MTNGAPIPTGAGMAPPNLNQIMPQLASGPPVGPIPTTPYAPANVAPIYQAPQVKTPSPFAATQASPGGAGVAAGGRAQPSWMDQVRGRLGLGASPQQGMNMMNLPPALQQQLLMMLMQPGALGAGRPQGGGGMMGLGGSSGGAGGIPGRDVSAGTHGGAPTY